MITWCVDQKDVDVAFSLKDLQDFSKKHNAKVIVRGFAVIENGGIVKLFQ